MGTLRDLLRSSWERVKQLAMLNGAVEDYVLFTMAKLGAFAGGVAVGYYLL
jgi:hypothetical protein